MAWRGERKRHGLARQGIKTANPDPRTPTPIMNPDYPSELERLETPEGFNFPFHATPNERRLILKDIKETNNPEVVLDTWLKMKEPKDKRLKNYLWIVKDYRTDDNPTYKEYYVTKESVPGEYMKWVTDPEELEYARQNIHGVYEDGHKVQYRGWVPYEEALYTEEGKDYKKLTEKKQKQKQKQVPEGQKQDFDKAWKQHRERRIQELKERERQYRDTNKW